MGFMKRHLERQGIIEGPKCKTCGEVCMDCEGDHQDNEVLCVPNYIWNDELNRYEWSEGVLVDHCDNEGSRPT